MHNRLIIYLQYIEREACIIRRLIFVTIATLTPPSGAGWVGVVGGSVYKLSRHLLQSAERLLKLEAFGDGLLLASQGFLL